MSTLFISHSSRDNAAAAEIKTWLQSRGHNSLFLDFDPASGIAAGRDWERELYRQLRACRAVIVLCSQASMASTWVFAEIALARALGKQLFPIQIENCTVVSLLADVVDRGLTVAIGSETGVAPLAECSLVVSPYEIAGEHAGSIAVLGPTRMNYSQALSAVAAVSHQLGNRLSEG